MRTRTWLMVGLAVLASAAVTTLATSVSSAAAPTTGGATVWVSPVVRIQGDTTFTIGFHNGTGASQDVSYTLSGTGFGGPITDGWSQDASSGHLENYACFTNGCELRIVATTGASLVLPSLVYVPEGSASWPTVLSSGGTWANSRASR